MKSRKGCLSRFKFILLLPMSIVIIPVSIVVFWMDKECPYDNEWDMIKGFFNDVL